MSLKDDFLEALRSVKRDFVRDYESDTPNADHVPARPQDPPQEAFREPARAQQESPSPRPAQAAEPVSGVVPPADRPASMRNQFQPEMHTPSDPGTPNPPRPAQVHTPPPTEDTESSSPETESGFTPDYSSYSNYTQNTGGSYDDEPPVGSRFTLDNFKDDALGDERTIISKNTTITGGLQTDDSVRLFGQIKGDIDCSSNILVAGKIRGNTSAANAYIINAQVDGNVLCDDVVNVTDDAWILGNIRAQQADIDGKIKGNIEIRHSISIGSNSSIIGNISTDELEIRRGAFVNGQIMMYSPSRDVIDRFDRFDQ